MKTLLLLTPFLLGNSAGGGLGAIMLIYGLGYLLAFIVVVGAIYLLIKSRHE
jgi:hypothetical protein